MKVLIIRHAVAEKKSAFAKAGKPDFLRPLTKAGKREMRRAAKGLSRVVDRIEILATSSYLRARQTADVVKKSFRKSKLIEIDELIPDRAPADACAWLSHRREGVVALVGHEPHLSRLIAYLCARSEAPFMELEKGQVCLMEYDRAARRGRVVWSLTPGQLERLK